MTRREPALPGPEDDDRLADAQPRHVDGPAEAGADRVEQHGDLGRDVVRHPMHERVRIEVHVLRVAAPERRRHATPACSRTPTSRRCRGKPVAPLHAVAAVAARQQRLDRDAVAALHAPAAAAPPRRSLRSRRPARGRGSPASGPAARPRTARSRCRRCRTPRRAAARPRAPIAGSGNRFGRRSRAAVLHHRTGGCGHGASESSDQRSSPSGCGTAYMRRRLTATDTGFEGRLALSALDPADLLRR